MSVVSDPLDADEFDPISYINEKFPTESSLEELDTFIGEVEGEIDYLDKEISQVIQVQSLAGKQATKEILDAYSYIEELFGKVNDIKSKAAESESMVQDLCADIKRLDCAKNHLQTSITSLNRLQMLMSAVNQLELLSGEMQFKEAANLLDAVKQFMSHFESYKDIRVIFDLNNRIDQIRGFLTRKIKQIFIDLSENIDTVADGDLALPSVPGGLKTVADACYVVDALGYQMKKDLLSDFVQRQLAGYEHLFGQGKEHFNLDDMDRRWAWFRRLLRYIDMKFKSIFPAHWRLQLRLCLEFVERTKMHLILLLTEFENNDTGNTPLLLKALDSAVRFEREMADKFNLLRELQESKARDQAKERQRKEEIATQQRLKKDDKIMYIPTDHDAENREEETESGFLSLAHSAISGGLSGVFDKFLGSYIAYERQQLEEMLVKVSREEDVANNDEESENQQQQSQPLNVYQSSTNMFLFIKKSIGRCIKLTTGQSFLALTEEFQQCMMQYIEILKNRCPPELPPVAPGYPPIFKLPINGEVTMAYLINTGEYCAETVPQLQQMIQQKISPNLANKVDYTAEEEAFMDLVAHCLKVLVYGMLDRLEPNFRTMQNTNWATFEEVGEESAYLHACNSILIESIPKIRAAISASYFNNFCTKLATEILTRFLDAIMKQKKISDSATQQLLLDTYNLKTLLLHLPTLSPDTSINKTTPATGMYAKFVNNKTAHIEMLLKLIGTPDDMLIDRFKIMWPDGRASDLQMVMALKGTKKQDQQAILEALGLASEAAANKPVNGSTAGKFNIFGGTGTGLPSSTALNSTFAATTAATTAASAAAFSSVKNLTQDLSSTARNAFGNFKLPNK